MALISETYDDGSNGGDPNKKPEELHKNQQEKEEEEEENQNENPNEDDQEEEEIENLPPIPRHISEELIEIILALVRRCHYPRLSLISRAFRHVISSQELFVRRSRLGLTEPVLYTWISSPPFDHPSWFILYRRNASLRLSRIPSLPPKLQGSTAVTIGHNMYLMGGCVGLNQPVDTVIVIDCRFHTYRELPSMRRDRCYAAAGVIDGKIYVVGGRKKRYDGWVEVFDVENEIWETVPGPDSRVASSRGVFSTHVVMDNKIYILDDQYCLVYDPRQRTWKHWGSGSQQRRFWNGSSCVVDDMLYTIDPTYFLGTPFVVYDPRDMVWRPVKGLDPWPPSLYTDPTLYKMANFGGKLVVLSKLGTHYNFHVWYEEIALEKLEDGDIWGKVDVESMSLVHSFRKSPFFEHSQTVTV